MGRLNPLICIGIPTWGSVSMQWASAYRHLGGLLGSTICEIQVTGKEIGAARNELMRGAIENKADFLFMLGDDVLPPGDAIHRLWTRMQHDPDLDLCTGVYWTKTNPPHPYLWRDLQRGPFLDWLAGEYLPVDFAGCDCLLIRLSERVKALGPSWFSTTWDWEPGSPAVPGLATEDFYFYTRARETGIRLYADTNVQCLHQDRQTGEFFGLTHEMPQAGAAPADLPEGAETVIAIADLGAGRNTPWFGETGRVRVDRFDGNEAVRPTYRCDLRALPVPDQSYDVVHARHVLEHFGRADVPAVLKEWLRILRVGGRFVVNVPNLAYAARRLLAYEAGEEAFNQYTSWQLYGEQADPYDYHKTGFTPSILRDLLSQGFGLDDVQVEEREDGMNLHATARKAAHLAPFALVPAWDEIAAREGRRFAGMNPADVEAETPAYGGEVPENGHVREGVLIGGE